MWAGAFPRAASASTRCRAPSIERLGGDELLFADGAFTEPAVPLPDHRTGPLHGIPHHRLSGSREPEAAG